MEDYPNLKKLLEKHSKAVNSQSKEIRFSTIEIGNIINDITNLSLSVRSEKITNERMTKAIIELRDILISMMDDDTPDTFK